MTDINKLFGGGFSAKGPYKQIFNINLDCMTGKGLAAQISVDVTHPVSVFVIFALISSIAHLMQKPLRQDFVWNVIGKIFSSLYVSVTRTTLQTFSFEAMPGGKHHMLKAFPSVEYQS